MGWPSSDEAAPGAGEQGSSSEERIGHPESLRSSTQRQTSTTA